MLLTASSEFVALCRSQVDLLTQGLGASLSAVYLAEEWEAGAETRLTPIVTYPEATTFWEIDEPLNLLPEASDLNSPVPRLISAESQMLLKPGERLIELHSPQVRSPEPTAKTQPPASPETLLPQQQVVLPLIHEELVLGLLVTAREDRCWSETEQTQIGEIANTLAIACILDQRAQWLEQERQQQGLLQAQQRDLLDDLLHQFRNPLTALRTFGKLLLKRFLPSDPNSNFANSIVRESDRLQELLQQFERVIDLDSEPLPLAPASHRTATSIENSEIIPVSAHRLAVTRPLLPGSRPLLGAHLSLTSCLIPDILEPLLSSAQAIAQERQLQLYSQIAPGAAVLANAQALREVLSNLLDNALKYTPAGGAIFIGVLQPQEGMGLGLDSKLPGKATDFQVIALRDTGCGIPPADLPHIFERHYRGIQADTEIPGTGLGLGIAKELVEQMQGYLQVFSPADYPGLNSVLPAAIRSHANPGTLLLVWLPVVKMGGSNVMVIP